MLIISRKKDQKIIVADDIEITILEVGRNRVRFGIKAPKHIPIHTRLKDTPVSAERPAEPIVTPEPPAVAIAPVPNLPLAIGMAKRR
jgi:carbon storage regulator CsrA